VREASWFFVSDLHGHLDRYRKLFDAIERERPAAVLLGGDLLPSLAWARHDVHGEFVAEVLGAGFAALRARLAESYPAVFLIFGNDDPRCEEPPVLEFARDGLWEYVHGRRSACGGFPVYGYACVPPTPFRLKDWERYDVSRYVDPGCYAPADGWHTTPVPEHELTYATIEQDLDRLAGADDLEEAVLLLHAPPHRTNLDRAALDGRMVDHAPVDVHVGSIAVRRLIEARQPRVTLHGHIHESARLTGTWRDRLGRTVALSAAHDGPELALVRFDPARPELATRELL
jgi:Icc-related predicted phosphoesterase